MINTDANEIRRRRRRKPTMNGRFAANSLALEIGLIRVSMDMVREFDKKESAEILEFPALVASSRG